MAVWLCGFRKLFKLVQEVNLPLACYVTGVLDKRKVTSLHYRIFSYEEKEHLRRLLRRGVVVVVLSL